MNENLTPRELYWVNARRVIYNFFISKENAILLPFNNHGIAVSNCEFEVSLADVVPDISTPRLARFRDPPQITLKNRWKLGIAVYEHDKPEEMSRMIQSLQSILEEVEKNALQEGFVYIMISSVTWVPYYPAIVIEFRYSDPTSKPHTLMTLTEREFCGTVF